MNLNEYQQFTINSAFFTENKNIDFLSYLTIGISGESGELANKVKKIYRDKRGIVDNEDKEHLALELGDIIWYISVLAKKLGFTIDELLQMNVDKINRRIKNKTQEGSGDER